MKFDCRQEFVAKALGLAGRAVAQRSTLPVLGNVLVSADSGDGVWFSATNLDMAIRVCVPATIHDGGSTTLPSRLFTEVVGSMPNDTVSFELFERTQETRIVCGRSETKMKGISHLDFPNLPQWDKFGGVPVEFPVNLSTVIERAVVSASTDASRPTLMGIELESSGGRIRMAATDGSGSPYVKARPRLSLTS